MKKLFLFCFFVTLISFSNLIAQKSYFQQETNYKISVKLNDISHELSAFETIEYINHSSDTLKYIYFHLWPNAYKNNKTAFARQEIENGDSKFYNSTTSERGYIDSLDFKVNGQKAVFTNLKDSIDIGKLILTNPLLPGEKISISTPFHVKIPSDFSRFGHVGQSYQITQWYPKPAVYDRDGWHQMPYLNQGEFYSEYGSFDVTISVPKNYIVASSGELLDKEEITWLNEKALETSKIDTFGTDASFPKSTQEYKTLHFAENRIHDFAWFADKRYHVLKDSVKLPTADAWVTTWTMFTNKESSQWKKSQEYIKDAISYYSKWYGDYPYRSCTAVQGAISAGGAMEYPKITVVGPSSSDLMLEEMIMHEVGHNWFYGFFGFNERRYPYLDEGFNSFSENRYFVTKYNNSRFFYEMIMPLGIAKLVNIESFTLSHFYESFAINPLRYHTDQSMDLPADEFTEMNYFSIVYEKSSIAFYYLLNYLGEAKFDSIMHVFYNQWRYKHPSPDDFRKTFESSTTKDLTWFFDDLVKTTKHVNYKIAKIKTNKLLIKNIGDITSPVNLTGYSGKEKQFSVWIDGFSKSKWIEIPELKVDKVTLNEQIMPEYNRKNNFVKTQGLFKKIEPIRINMVQIIENPEKTSIGIFPVLGWNHYNKIMLGAVIYNPVFPMQKFDYQIMPLYGTGNHEISGLSKITLHTFPFQTILERVDFSISGQLFGYETGAKGKSYYKIRQEMNLILKKKYPRSLISNQILVNYTYIDDNYSGSKTFSNLQYKLAKKSILNPYTININLESSENYLKSFAEINYSFSANYSKNAIHLRLFGGYFLKNNAGSYPFHLSGVNGSGDYQYDQLYLARFEENASTTLSSNQFTENEGGFASLSPYYSDSWLVSMNAKVKVPKLPLNVYFSSGTYNKAGNTFEDATSNSYATNKFAYETGINISINEIMNIYFPVLVSKDIQSYLDNNTENYLQKIRFSINIKLLNPFNLRDLIK